MPSCDKYSSLIQVSVLVLNESYCVHIRRAVGCNGEDVSVAVGADFLKDPVVFRRRVAMGELNVQVVHNMCPGNRPPIPQFYCLFFRQKGEGKFVGRAPQRLP
eukprot:11801815-Heterocapsa_arctica.AAC.1